ncbi:MAG: hypothetical protein L3J56_00065 [Bacteroidales bacterium]|nr:hypothetical protein [Bacteroidales bacterium]
MKTHILILVFFLSAGSVFSQSSLSVRLLTISAHPFAKQNLPLHQNKIDNKGYFTFEPGLIFSYDRFIAKKLSFRISTSVMNDRYNTLAGYSQIMLKYKVLKYYKHSFYIGFGPAIHYETDKTGTEGWVNEANYKQSGNTLYKVSWLSGMAEYNYYLTKKIDLAVTLNHTHSRSLGLSIGVRFDIPDPNGKGCDCPSFR